VCDHTPPVITNTPANIPCVEATSPSGAVVTYTNPSATDIVDTSVVVICVKASGSTFAVGVNTVICTARDSHGNSATSSFTIEVGVKPCFCLFVCCLGCFCFVMFFFFFCFVCVFLARICFQFVFCV
jgi:hypothetical protein